MKLARAKLSVGIMLLALVVAAEPMRQRRFSDWQRAPQPSVAPHWRSQSSGTLARLSSIFFIDAQRGWATGSKSVLLTTEDGGALWRRVLFNASYANEPLHDLWFFDALRGCVLGEYASANYQGRRGAREWTERVFAVTSADGGASWLAATLAHPLPQRANQVGRTGVETQDTLSVEPDAVLVRMAFADDRAGWACGESGTIQATRDGGRTWEMQAAPTRKLLYDVATVVAPQTPAAPFAQAVWIVGAGGTILHTIDGGRSWNEQQSGTPATLRAVHFSDGRRGWAVGAGGVILVTTNGGARWQAQNSGTDRQLNDVFFLNDKEGWAAGERGLLLHTSDGGVTWESEELNTHANLNRLFFRAPHCGWVVGASGAIFQYSE